jgi:hypothetical protein
VRGCSTEARAAGSEERRTSGHASRAAAQRARAEDEITAKPTSTGPATTSARSAAELLNGHALCIPRRCEGNAMSSGGPARLRRLSGARRGEARVMSAEQTNSQSPARHLPGRRRLDRDQLRDPLRARGDAGRDRPACPGASTTRRAPGRTSRSSRRDARTTAMGSRPVTHQVTVEATGVLSALPETGLRSVGRALRAERARRVARPRLKETHRAGGPRECQGRLTYRRSGLPVGRLSRLS